MLPRLLLLCFVFSAASVTQGQSTNQFTICDPTRCINSLSNITIGLGLVNSHGSIIQLLPGKYSSSDVPLGRESLSPPVTVFSGSSSGYNISSTVPPFEIALQPGLVMYSDQFYSGRANFISLRDSFSNQTIPLGPGSGSIAISKNVWVAIDLDAANPTIFYDTAPHITLPSKSQSIAVIDYQSSTCQPPCSGSGVCTASGKCACASGFTGPSCESCASGFFGPACRPCPSPCNSCDQTSGLCSTPKAFKKVKRAPETCSCQNGQCNSDGSCSCLPGWTNTTDLNGVTCTQCAPGFFLTSTGDCQICQLGCSKCEDDTGNCVSCQKGFGKDQTDQTKCDPLSTVTKNSTCPTGSYSTGEQCALCSSSCETCNGPSSTDCVICPSGKSMFNGNCVTVNSDGVCEGTNGMIANNNKQMCDACGSKCTACKIPNFGPSSTIDQAQCTSCLAGLIPSKGKCETQSCPKGQFISGKSCKPCSSICASCTDTAENCLSCPKGQFLSGSSCKPCSSACASCSGTAENCLTCTNRLASGNCASTCPEGSFNSSSTCVTCHGDCAACSGPSFNQCTKCPPNRPVFSNGRCLRTCGSKTQFFDPSLSLCQPCHSSCSSCSAAGSNHCLACSNSSAILQNGACSSSSSPSCIALSSFGMCFTDTQATGPN